jgi:hypothetical protein
MHHIQKEYMNRNQRGIVMFIKITLSLRHFGEEQIYYILNYVINIALNVWNLDIMIMIKDAKIVKRNILMIIFWR